MRGSILASVGAVASALASALCCAGPILYVSLGVGAGLAGTFEPLRPWFLGGAVLFLGLAFRRVSGRSPEACVADAAYEEATGEGSCTVEYDPAILGPDRIARAIREAGFGPRLREGGSE